MAKGKSKQLPPGVILADGEPLDLGNRYLAAVLAWVIPGAGHFYQKRYLKSAIFSVAIFSTFLIGMIVSGSRCVYASWNGTEKRWQYVLQSGNGFAAIPAGIQAYSKSKGTKPPFGKFMTAPKTMAELDSWHEKTASGFDMGTLYTMISGLLNLLVVFDAFAGPLPPPAPKTKSQGTKKSIGEAAKHTKQDAPEKKINAEKSEDSRPEKPSKASKEKSISSGKKGR